MVGKISLLLLLLVSSSFAQVSIKNPKYLAIPKDRVQIIFKSTCRVVAEEFHVPSSQIQFPLALVLGEDDERYTADENTGTYTIYLRVWNQNQFANSAMRLAVLRLVPRGRRNQMLSEILSRSSAIAPISVEEFKQLGAQRRADTTAHAIPLRRSRQP